MSLRVAVLIDGGYLTKELAARKAKAAGLKGGGVDYMPTADEIDSYAQGLLQNESLSGARLIRVFFYNAPPLKKSIKHPISGETIDLSATPLARYSDKLHSDLKRKHFFAIRMGELRHQGWELKPHAVKDIERAAKAGKNCRAIVAADFRPEINQKGVDLRIGLDIAWISLKRTADILVIISADSDLIPAFKLARAEGVQVFLDTCGNAPQEGMAEHSDFLFYKELDVLTEAAPAETEAVTAKHAFANSSSLSPAK
jgi:uncharacterized LabA/DUF88 family protein